jgi:nitrogenase molybdenum-iron protein alpha/beta subunit
MHHYTKGISMALLAIADRFCTKKWKKTDEISVNLLGVTPLDFSLNGSVDSIKSWILQEGMTVNSCFAMGSSLEEIKMAGRAHVNLVLSYGGLAAAKLLEQRFGIPYVVGVPYGRQYADQLASQLRQAAWTGKSVVSYQKETKRAHSDYAIIGESIACASLATAIEMECDVKIKVLTPVDTEHVLLRKQDRKTPDEDDLIEQLQSVQGVIADPMYQALWNKDRGFYTLPHEAFSGRMYDAVNPDLINRSIR